MGPLATDKPWGLAKKLEEFERKSAEGFTKVLQPYPPSTKNDRGSHTSGKQFPQLETINPEK